LIKNGFFEQVQKGYQSGATKEELAQILGRARAKKGMFEGDLDEGELEIGQVSAMINEVKPAAEVFNQLMKEYREARQKLLSENFDW
jgi:enoyl-[acyl-carrier protein] reductase II